MAGRTLRSLALVVVAACSSSSAVAPGACSPPSATVRFSDGSALNVEVARDAESQAEGLMGVTELPPEDGMAFVFDAPTVATFWMKDTLIPLSIAFVRGDRIVTIREMTPCERDPCRTYVSDAPYTLAIEANAGWFGDHGLQVGDRASLDQTACL